MKKFERFLWLMEIFQFFWHFFYGLNRNFIFQALYFRNRARHPLKPYKYSTQIIKNLWKIVPLNPPPRRPDFKASAWYGLSWFILQRGVPQRRHLLRGHCQIICTKPWMSPFGVGHLALLDMASLRWAIWNTRRNKTGDANLWEPNGKCSKMWL